MADIDMFTYLLTAQQPPLPPPPQPKPAPPAPPNPSEFPTRAQAREKTRKEMEELRAWWADLPEERRQEVRDTKIAPTLPKPKKPKKDCGKKKEKEPEPEKKPDP